MELEKCGDGDHSNEMQSALKKFEEVCNSLEDEHVKLLELEKRRQKLNEDLERLRNEIKEEKKYFRTVIDETFPDQSDEEKTDGNNEQLGELVEPLTLDSVGIKEFIQNQRQKESTSCDDDDVNNQINASRLADAEEREEAAAAKAAYILMNNNLDTDDEDTEILDDMSDPPQMGDPMEYLTSEEE